MLSPLENAAKFFLIFSELGADSLGNTTQMISTKIVQVIALIFVFYIKLCLLDLGSVLRTKLGCVKLKIWEKPDHGSV